MSDIRLFVYVDEIGRPIGFYNNDIFPDVVTYAANPNFGSDDEPAEIETGRDRNPGIPVDAIEVTQDQCDQLSQAGKYLWDKASKSVVAQKALPLSEVMPKMRQEAFDTAMAFGNRITDQVERKWSNIERQSFTAQEIEAKAIMAGEVMSEDAMLPVLAEDKGVTAKEYAQQVLENAAVYRNLAIAAVILRRGADALMNESIDTPEKLSAAMDQLRIQAAMFCDQFGLKFE